MEPASWRSSPLMQRIKVDLPEPDGPQMTTLSPDFTLKETSFSASKSPNLFTTFLIWISSSVAAWAI